MFCPIVIIMMAWVIPMPVWLSVLGTVMCGIKMVKELISMTLKLFMAARDN